MDKVGKAWQQFCKEASVDDNVSTQALGLVERLNAGVTDPDLRVESAKLYALALNGSVDVSAIRADTEKQVLDREHKKQLQTGPVAAEHETAGSGKPSEEVSEVAAAVDRMGGGPRRDIMSNLLGV